MSDGGGRAIGRAGSEGGATRVELSASFGRIGILGDEVAEGLEVELLVEARQVSVGSDGQQLVSEVHQDAVSAGGVIGEGGLELGGHQRGVAGGLEQVVEAGEQLGTGPNRGS